MSFGLWIAAALVVWLLLAVAAVTICAANRATDLPRRRAGGNT